EETASKGDGPAVAVGPFILRGALARAPQDDGVRASGRHFFFPGKPPSPGRVGLPLRPVSPGRLGRPVRKPGGSSFGRLGMPSGSPPPLFIFSAIAFICSGEGMA